MTLEFFRSQNVLYPELCFLTSSAVGFPISIYWIGAEVFGAKGDQYQVMRWDESDGLGKDFWGWYLNSKEQFFGTPEVAAAMFVREWQAWRKNVTG